MLLSTKGRYAVMAMVEIAKQGDTKPLSLGDVAVRLELSLAYLEQLFMKLGTEWDGFTVHPKEFYDAGDTVIVEGRYTGTFKATGKSMDAVMCHILKLRDGKITSFQQFVDTAQWQAVMG